MKKKETPKICTDCGNAAAVWILRARTKFLCDECRRKMEWHDGVTDAVGSKLERIDEQEK